MEEIHKERFLEVYEKEIKLLKVDHDVLLNKSNFTVEG